MQAYTIEQRVRIVTVFWMNRKSIAPTIQMLRGLFRRDGVAPPSEDLIRHLDNRFRATGSVCLPHEVNHDADTSDDDMEDEEQFGGEEDEEENESNENINDEEDLNESR